MKNLYHSKYTAQDNYPKDKTIIDLIEEQVKKTPDNLAVVFENMELTNQALNEKSNQPANYLRAFAQCMNTGGVVNRLIWTQLYHKRK